MAMITDATLASITEAEGLAFAREVLRIEAEAIERGLRTTPAASGSGDGAGAPSGGDPRARARRDLVHALFSHNDFLTIH